MEALASREADRRRRRRVGLAVTGTVGVALALVVLLVALRSTTGPRVAVRTGDRPSAGSTTLGRGSAATPTGVVSGRLELVGGPGQHGPFPVAGSVVARPSEGGAPSTSTADSHGLFALVLPPGRYELTGRSVLYGDGTYICHADHPATVTAGATTSSNVLCQMK
jgi:hypothetical protein